MECKHDLKYLRGTAEGVICTNCGMRWAGGDFPAMNPPEPVEDQEAPKPKTKRRTKKNAD